MSVTAYPRAVREEGDREGGLAIVLVVIGLVLLIGGAVLVPGSLVLGTALVLLGLLLFGVAGTLYFGGVWLLTGAGILVLVIVLGLLAQRFG